MACGGWPLSPQSAFSSNRGRRRLLWLAAVASAGKGFSFLFKDTHTQVWQLIMAYIDGCEQRAISRSEVLPLLFQLAFLEPGLDYSAEGKTKSQQVFISDLARFGLLYQRKVS